MHTVVRTYSGEGASEVFAVIQERSSEVEELIRGVPGFVSYAAVPQGDGGVTVTICEDSAGTEESSRRAADFIREHLTGSPAPPEIAEGEAVLHFTA